MAHPLPLEVIRPTRGADMMLAANREPGRATISLASAGFEAWRELDADDLRDIRDWIDAALAALASVEG